MLHILNGDAVVPVFRKAGLPGDFAVWRELHCQGPTLHDITSTHFAEVRKKFLKEYLDLPYHFYGQSTNSQLNKIRNTLDSQVTLWFEYDLFCQLNMMVVINFIRQLNPETEIFLINVGKTLEHNEWLTLSQLKPEEWKKQFEKRRLLDVISVDFMLSAWNIYCSDDHLAFENIMAECPPVYKYFPLAIENHYRRFPSRQDNLTDIQRYIFQNLLPAEYTDEKSFLQKLLRDFHFYGYGDLQYKAILGSLSHFIQHHPTKGYRLKNAFSGRISIEESIFLPEMIYGGQSNKQRYLEDFIEI